MKLRFKEESDFTKDKKKVITFISDWIEKSTSFKVKNIELEYNPFSIWNKKDKGAEK